MSDFLLTLGKSPRARAAVRRLGLPIPLPVALRRDPSPWRARPLAEERIVVGAFGGARMLAPIASCLAAAGADAYLASPDLTPAFLEPCETFGRPARPLDALGPGARIRAVVYDATGIGDLAGLPSLFESVQPLVSRLASSGRIVVVARGGGEPETEAAAAQAALEGFVRSVAKEIGRAGATANLIRVEDGARKHLAPVLRFLLSGKSAFITGQPIAIGTPARDVEEQPPLVRPLEKKIALVTGAARGIGAATARALALEGAHVVCLDRPADVGPASQLAREIGGTPLGVDVAAEGGAGVVEQAVRALGGVDVLVHNAGITRDKTLARMSSEQWGSVLAVNLGAVLRMTAALEPLLRDQGRIVCLSSVAGIAGNVGQTAYAASKAGVLGFVRATAERLAERGITVNAVAPGFIETKMTAAMPMAIREAARRLSALGQGGRPEDVAQAIVFLASPGAQGITGRALRVCGGAFVGA